MPNPRLIIDLVSSLSPRDPIDTGCRRRPGRPLAGTAVARLTCNRVERTTATCVSRMVREPEVRCLDAPARRSPLDTSSRFALVPARIIFAMTERGLPSVDDAPACPFVAFEDDRESRSTTPDHRHRCFAEPLPTPRAAAHQEAYCLSSAFPVCPTFQDWAKREAARARADGGRSTRAP